MRTRLVPAIAGKFLSVLLILLSFSFLASAQNFHQLTIDDFQGVPNGAGEGSIAFTDCTIGFRYEAHPERNYYRLVFNITLELNKNRSWMDKGKITSGDMLAEILKHEQGHYMIAYMEQQELIRTVSKVVFRSDYNYAARNIFNRIDAKYRQLNQNYDDDTNHMLNRDQQHSWDIYFNKRMEYMPTAAR